MISLIFLGIMMYDFYIWINTYNREGMLHSLVGKLLDQLHPYDFYIQVYLDGCEYRKYHFGVTYEQLPHHGKENYYKLCSYALRNLKVAKYYIKIDDDMDIPDDFIEKCVKYWESITELPSAINLLRDNRQGLWGAEPEKHYNEYLDVSGWTDLNFMADYRFFKYLGSFELEPPPEFIKSSGVGRQVCRYLRKIGSIYRVKESLLIHGDHDSMMNPERKEKITNI